MTCWVRRQASVFEYSLEKLAMRAMNPRTAMAAPHGGLGLADRADQLGVVFSVLARHGARDGGQARRAYEAGIGAVLPRIRPAYHVIEDWVPVFDTALDSLRGLKAAAKQMMIEGLVRTIAHDNWLAPEEADCCAPSAALNAPAAGAAGDRLDSGALASTPRGGFAW
jgi:hypothetical protein